MLSGTRFEDELTLNDGTLVDVGGPFTYDKCNSIVVGITQVQEPTGEGAIAAAAAEAVVVTTAEGLKTWKVELTQFDSGRRFRPGVALATASAVVTDRNTTKLVTWSHDVTLV